MKSKDYFFKRYPRLTLLTVVVLIVGTIDMIGGTLSLPNLPGTKSPYYHHDLKKNYHGRDRWGPIEYEMSTNSLGFKDARCRGVKIKSSKLRILIIGDSFTEGIGMPFQDTFVGIISAKYAKNKYEVLNGAVRSYSPKLYYLKTKYLIEKVGLTFDELWVFIDISDTQDELVYAEYDPNKPHPHNSDRTVFSWMLQHSLIVQRVKKLKHLKDTLTSKGRPIPSGDTVKSDYYKERDKWTTDRKIYDKWGKKGLILARGNLIKLYDLCASHNIEMRIAVYPWKNQIRRRDLDSVQISYWKNFSAEENIPFLNLFPYFINGVNAEEVIKKYFIDGDVHWNRRGHQLVAEAINSEWLKEKK